MSSERNAVLWSVLLVVIVVPLAAATMSPQLSWRGPIYIAAGFAGIIGMILLLLQPLLIGRYLSGLSTKRSRQLHRIAGSLLVICVISHVMGLWITSPPDMIDALLFRSPTPFSVWGVLAMWTILGVAFLAIFQKRFRVKPTTWRLIHFTLAASGSICSVVHALQIDGTMETLSKAVLCILVLVATIKVGVDLYYHKTRLF